MRDEPVHELVEHLFLNQEARQRHADLAGIAEFDPARVALAAAISASAKTMAGAWPPSSIVALHVAAG